ncbi:thiopurine S-methyltransferase [Zestomonas carbonaria]|uniref:Thiopurine S-methyltransferase n=1 Tax=Zestomonas carbonaria TaxID=2762745 RepID=A0A7U7IB38_9GAMM|nr:thiopurine S-methyltransferase [Pseudomonas carbonaria]CAD5110050.1 Thiopurine S-methyltransferase [Pseudomonas carbonaria]
MEQDFWQERWAQGQIGFHLKQVNPYLQRHWSSLGLARDSRVLVPLCGKSLDLAWLAAQGHAVLGVELAEQAVRDFFAEQGLVADVEVRGGLRIHRAGRLELWCGDFFALTPADVADCTALYDRAALIALPPAMRERYVAHLAVILPGGCEGLLVTLEYAQERMEGPPFSVPEDEVQDLLAADWQIECLERVDVLGENWKFLERGLPRLDEAVYRLRKRG